MIKNILLIFLGLFFILPLLAMGAAFLGKAPKCPPFTNNSSTNLSTPDLKTLEKTGALSLTDAEATKLINQSPNEAFEETQICFTKNEVHISAKLAKIPFKPSVYLTLEPQIEGTNVQLKKIQGQIGWLPAVGPLEDFAKARINEYLSEMKNQEEITLEINTGEIKVTLDRIVKTKPSPKK